MIILINKELTQKILFLENVQDFEIFNNNSFDTDNIDVFSFNIEIHNLCESKKINHKIAEDFLDKDDHDKIYKYVTSFYNWHEHDSIPKDLEFEGINLLSLFDTAELHHLLIREIYLFITLKRLLENFSNVEILANSHLLKIIKCFSDNTKSIVIGDSKHIFSVPFQQYSFSFSFLGINIPIKLSRNSYRKIKNFVESTLGRIFDLWFSEKKLKKSVLFLEFNPEQYTDLFNHLSKTKKNIVLLNTRRPAIWNFNSIKLLKKFNCKIITPKYFLSKFEKNSISKILKQYDKKIENLWIHDEAFFNLFTIENYSIWPIIKDPLLQVYKERLQDYIELIIFCRKISKKLDLSCMISLNVFGETEKTMLKINDKIPSILLEHGFTNYVPELSLFDISNMYPLFKDKIALWGDIQKDYLVKQKNISNEKILSVGSPRHDVFFNKNIEIKNESITILIIPGQLDESNAIYDTRLFLKYEMLLKKLFSVLKSIPNISYLVKLHPSLQKNNLYVKNIIQKIDSNIIINQFSNILDDIQSSSIIINIFTELFPSTALLEGLLLKKPILNLCLHDYDYEFEFEKDKAVLSVKYNDNLKINIEKILFDKNFQSLLINNGTQHTKRYLSNPGTASQKLASILNSF